MCICNVINALMCIRLGLTIFGQYEAIVISKARGKGLMIRKNGVVLYLECIAHIVGHYVVHVFILPLFPSFFTPPLPLSSISHQVSHILLV